MYGHRTPRPRTLVAYALVTIAVVVLFAFFIGFRRDVALVGALSAAGTVLAAGFAAMAALGSMRAAAESSVTANRSREALARTMRPTVRPDIGRQDGEVLGTVRCGEGRGALDVTVAWLKADGETVTGRTARLEPSRPDLPSGSDTALAVDLELPESATGWDETTMVWIEYWDDSHVGHWQDTWQVGTEPGSKETYVQTDSQLVD